jgi:hypothetical protein
MKLGKIVLISLIAAACTLASCDAQSGHSALAPVSDNTASAPLDEGVIPFAQYDPGDGTLYEGTMYVEPSQIALDRFQEVSRWSMISGRLETYVEDGFRINETLCVYAVTEKEIDTGEVVPVWMTILTLSCSSDPNVFVVLTHAKVKGIGYSVSIELIRYGNCDLPGYLFLGYSQEDGRPVYSLAVEESRYSYRSNQSCADPESFWTWLKCTASRAALGCGAAVAECATAGHGRRCHGAGCAGAALGAAVGCATR